MRDAYEDDSLSGGALGSGLGESDINLFGLDDFGEVAGARELWGAALGAAVGTGVAIGVRALAGESMARYSELIGLGAGLAVGGAMIAAPGTRAAGWTAVTTTMVGNGLRALEQLFLTPAASTPVGAVVPEAVNAFGSVVIEPTHALGAVVPETVQMAGAQLAGDAPPVSLLSNASLPASANYVQVLNGPSLSGLGQHFGSTVFGGG